MDCPGTKMLQVLEVHSIWLVGNGNYIPIQRHFWDASSDISEVLECTQKPGIEAWIIGLYPVIEKIRML